jgi:DNA-binding XRE family transcriptional regulator
MAREPESIDQQRRALGELLAAFRKAANLTQEQLAHAAFRDRSTVTHIENGRARADERFWQACDDTVKANGVLLAAFHDLEAAKQAHQQQEQRAQLAQARARANSLSTGVAGTSGTPAETEASSLAYAVNAASRRPSVRAGGSRDQSTHHAAAMASFRDVDRQVGGGHVYPAVAAYLSSTVSRDLLDVAISTSTFTAAAALSEMAGWMAHDAGDNAVAGQHFDRAVNLATVDSEPEVMVHLLASSAHLALHQGDPRRAASLAARGVHVLGQDRVSGQVHARLLAMQARAAARLGDRKGSVASLTAAESILARRSNEPRSPWVSRFDEASLAMEAARSLHIGGDLVGAREQAERVIARRSPNRARARALGQLMLAATHLEDGRADEAAALAVEVLTATRHLGSHVVIAHLRDIGTRLTRIGSGGIVSDAVELIRTGTPSTPFSLAWSQSTPTAVSQ